MDPRHRQAFTSLLKCYGLGWLLSNGSVAVFKSMLDRLLRRPSSRRLPRQTHRMALLLALIAAMYHVYAGRSKSLHDVKPPPGDSKLPAADSKPLSPETNFVTTWRNACLITLPLSLLAPADRLEWTLLAVVRCMDTYLTRSTPLIPVLLFVLSCTEIMWSWCYHPHALPASYVRWITRLAHIDPRLLQVLRWLRSGRVVYGERKGEGLESYLSGYCLEHGVDPVLGDVSRGFVGCGVVHPAVESCARHVGVRWWRGFRDGLRIYSVVYGLPLLFSLQRLLRSQCSEKAPPGEQPSAAEQPTDSPTTSRSIQHVQHATVSAIRSSAFLATFIASIWACVCTIRNKTHQDTGLAPLVGSALCGFSILLERKSRREEMALYCLPRAMYSLLHRNGWISGRAPGCVQSAVECLLVTGASGFVVATFLCRPERLRPFVRGMLRFFLGPSPAVQGSSGEE